MGDAFAALLPIRQACLDNAKRHLEAAKLLAGVGNYNVAFECALLALEEVGKAVILMMTRSRTLTNSDDQPDWMDDHTKKLFWAIWSIVFGREPITEATFRAYQGMARNLHQRRL